MSVTSAYVELAAVGDQFVQEHDKNSLFGLAQDADPGVFAFVLLAKGFDHGFSALVGQVQLDGTAVVLGGPTIDQSVCQQRDLDRLETAALLMPVSSAAAFGSIGPASQVTNNSLKEDHDQPRGRWIDDSRS